MKTGTPINSYLGVVDHINCRCNVDHTKESNAQDFWIIQSEPSLTLQRGKTQHKKSQVSLVSQHRIFPDYIIQII